MKKVVRKQVGLWMLVVVMLFALVATASAATEIESNNTLATATTFNYGEGAGGFVNETDTVDYWKINNVPAGTRVFNGYTGIAMSVLDSSGYVIATKPVGVYEISFNLYYNSSIYVVAHYAPGSGIYYYGYNLY